MLYDTSWTNVINLLIADIITTINNSFFFFLRTAQTVDMILIFIQDTLWQWQTLVIVIYLNTPRTERCTKLPTKFKSTLQTRIISDENLYGIYAVLEIRNSAESQNK